MSQNNTKLNTTVDDFFNTPTPQNKPKHVEVETVIVKNTVKPEKQNTDIPRKQKIIKGSDNIVKSIGGLQKKTFHMTDEHLDWYNGKYFEYKKKNKTAKDYQFFQFLFNEMMKADIKI